MKILVKQTCVIGGKHFKISADQQELDNKHSKDWFLNALVKDKSVVIVDEPKEIEDDEAEESEDDEAAPVAQQKKRK